MARTDQTSARGGATAPGIFAAAGLIAVVTLAARVFGFGRWLVFSHNVGATCIGSVYQAANQLPNVIFEIAAGGALAAVAVPIIAGQLALKDQAAATQTASAMLTWALTVLVPLSIVLAAAAGPMSGVLIDNQTCSGSTDLMASMLVVFAPQVALYGVGIVLAGVLQAHRRFLAAAMAPLLSSLVVIATYLVYGAVAEGLGDDLARLPGLASSVLAAGTTLGVVALSLPLLVPVRRAGIRLRPTWSFPPGVARRAAALASAGLVALMAQQLAVLMTLWLSQHRGGTGTLNVYTYVQAIYLLPYAVLAVPVATAAFPAMASGVGASAGEHARQTLASAARAITVAGCAGAAVLFAVAPPTGAFFSAMDAGRGSRAGADALAALPGALSSFAPGLVGFGLAALFTRALYVRGHPGVAAALVALGWLIAAALPFVLLNGAAGPRKTLQLLGLGSSLGMTVAAVGLFLAVRHAWGSRAFHRSGRTAAIAVGAGIVVAAAGRLVAGSLHPEGLAASVSVAVLVAIVVVVLFAAVIWFGDRESARLLVARIRGGRR